MYGREIKFFRRLIPGELYTFHFRRPRAKVFTFNKGRFRHSFSKMLSGLPAIVGIKYFGWSVSLLAHLIVLLTGLMVYSIFRGSAPAPSLSIESEPFFTGSTASLEHDNGKSILDAMSDKYPLPSQAWSDQSNQTVLDRILNDSNGMNHNAVIGMGAPSGDFSQINGGGLGPLGVSGGSIAAGPGISFLGVHSRADSAVIIIDTSGSMIDGWNYVESEVKSTIRDMRPYQKFAVIVFSDHDQILGPNYLLRATTAARQAIDDQLDNVAPQGHNDDMLMPFLTPFQRAFTMRPDSIYFLTDGNFDSRLIKSVADLYAGRNIPVYTFAYLDDPDGAASDADSIAKLKLIAAETRGEFHIISQSVLEQPE